RLAARQRHHQRELTVRQGERTERVVEQPRQRARRPLHVEAETRLADRERLGHGPNTLISTYLSSAGAEVSRSCRLPSINQGIRESGVVAHIIDIHTHHSGPPKGGDPLGVGGVLRAQMVGKNMYSDYKGMPGIAYYELTNFQLQQEHSHQAGIDFRL